MTDLPDFTPVTSSNIAGTAHDGQHLYVKFHNGSIWRYDAPASEHQALTAAASVGKHFHANVRSKYQGEKIA